jgi:hypothetical protein
MGQIMWDCAKKKRKIQKSKMISASSFDADPVPGPAYHFDADPDANPDFYLMSMRIQVNKMMRIRSNL